MQAKIRIFNKKRLIIGGRGGPAHYKDFLGGVGGAHEGGGPMFRLMPLPLLSLCMVANIWRGMSSGGLGIPSDLEELLILDGNVAEHEVELIFKGVVMGGNIGLKGSPPPMASVEYLMFVYSRVLFCKNLLFYY